jgi:hypothetical protein
MSDGGEKLITQGIEKIENTVSWKGYYTLPPK